MRETIEATAPEGEGANKNSPRPNYQPLSCLTLGIHRKVLTGAQRPEKIHTCTWLLVLSFPSSICNFRSTLFHVTPDLTHGVSRPSEKCKRFPSFVVQDTSTKTLQDVWSLGRHSVKNSQNSSAPHCETVSLSQGKWRTFGADLWRHALPLFRNAHGVQRKRRLDVAPCHT